MQKQSLEIQAVFIDRDGTIGGTGHFIHPKDFVLFPNAREAIRLLKNNGLPVFAFTNQYRISRGEASIQEFEEQLIVNVGSVGLPAYKEELPFPHVMESNSPHAVYVIANKEQGDTWNIEHMMIHYDWDQASTIAEDNGREDYACAIKTGRAFMG